MFKYSVRAGFLDYVTSGCSSHLVKMTIAYWREKPEMYHFKRTSNAVGLMCETLDKSVPSDFPEIQDFILSLVKQIVGNVAGSSSDPPIDGNCVRGIAHYDAGPTTRSRQQLVEALSTMSAVLPEADLQSTRRILRGQQQVFAATTRKCRVAIQKRTLHTVT